jgi:uncharacterized LabA/DUF88 family protein
MIFIDGSNLFHSWRRVTTKPLDTAKLVENLKTGRNLIRTYYFHSDRVPPKPEETAYHDWLRHHGMEVVTRPLKLRSTSTKCEKCGQLSSREIRVEKGVDVALVTMMLSFGFRHVYDTAVLVSGDEDYIGAVEELKHLGKRVEIAAFEGSTSPNLRKKADKFVSLDGMKDSLILEDK